MNEPYARVYFSIWDDERFVRIREDAALLGDWLRLLLLAEAAWPQSVAIPRCVPPDRLSVFVEDGVIDLHPADTYRIHGLDPERQRRSDRGVEANRRRWHPDTPSSPTGTPTGITDRTPNALLAPRSRTSSLSSTSPLELAVPSADPLLDALMVALGSAAPSKGAVEWADRLSAEYGELDTIRAFGNAAVAGPVKVISRTESALKEASIRRSRAEVKRKEADVSQARSDRMASLRVQPEADPRPLAEILKGLPK